MENIQWLSDKCILEKIGGQVREWRLQRNLSQKDLAKESGISLITLQKIEYGNGATLTVFLRVLRTLQHLDLFEIVMQEQTISPIEYHKMLENHKNRQRKRASKSKAKNNDTGTDSTPLW